MTDSKLELVSQGLSHKLALTLTQNIQKQNSVFIGSGAFRLGFITSPIEIKATYNTEDDQKTLDSFSFEAKKFKFKESYIRTSSARIQYIKNGKEILLDDLPENIFEPLGLLWEVVQASSENVECFAGAKTQLLVGGKMKELRFEPIGSGYQGFIKEKKIFTVENLKHGVTIKILNLPFQPEIKVRAC